ncbi:hypothetical protein HKCCE2091_09770 [Rhodobacterales bacterium HKCCE2091]|nr:hypothetical protein [Rhodobacterales bacterium HKCCE2091]
MPRGIVVTIGVVVLLSFVLPAVAFAVLGVPNGSYGGLLGFLSIQTAAILVFGCFGLLLRRNRVLGYAVLCGVGVVLATAPLML